MNISISGLTIEESQSFNTLIEVLSKPRDLLISRERIRSSMEFQSLRKENNASINSINALYYFWLSFGQVWNLNL